MNTLVRILQHNTFRCKSYLTKVSQVTIIVSTWPFKSQSFSKSEISLNSLNWWKKHKMRLWSVVNKSTWKKSFKLLILIHLLELNSKMKWSVNSSFHEVPKILKNQDLGLTLKKKISQHNLFCWETTLKKSTNQNKKTCCSVDCSAIKNKKARDSKYMINSDFPISNKTTNIKFKCLLASKMHSVIFNPVRFNMKLSLMKV